MNEKNVQIWMQTLILVIIINRINNKQNEVRKNDSTEYIIVLGKMAGMNQ